MAGEGKRFKEKTPKQFHLLGGKKVYLWAFETMVHSGLFELITLVCPKPYIAQVEKEVGSKAQVIEGGATRQESCLNGLNSCGLDTEIVLIHDAARPFVSEKILKANLTQAKIHGAVDTCIFSSDTIVYAKDGKKITSIPDRHEYLRGQTPQTFSYPLILEAHKKTKRTSSTDDCSLILELGKKVFVVEGEEVNLKITTPLDLTFAEAVTQDPKCF